jgi:hypothetical protein
MCNPKNGILTKKTNKINTHQKFNTNKVELNTLILFLSTTKNIKTNNGKDIKRVKKNI